MNVGDGDLTHQSQELPSMRPPQTSAVRRLRRSREHLGIQRHDLLVAMRVVNSIEREIVNAHWEDWLLEEDVKCRHLGAMLSQNTTEPLVGKANNRQQFMDGEPNRLKEIRVWQQQYCESCKKELETVVL